MARDHRRSPRRSPLADLDAVIFEQVDISRLAPVGVRPGLARYIADLHQRRHFIWADSRARAFSGNKDTLLGNLWLIGRPILDGFAFYVIFGLVLNAGGGTGNFVAFILVGVFMYQLTGRAIVGGTTLIRGSKPMIRAFAFPRASLALSLVLRDAFPDETVWSVYGIGYGFVPLVLPVLGLLRLRSTASTRDR